MRLQGTIPPESSSEEDEEPPKPVSSAEEDSDDESAKSDDSNGKQKAPPPTTSRLFAPYRSIGVVTDGRFHLVSHQSSSQAMAACPIGDRFQLVQTGKLNPVLVSHCIPNSTIHYVVTDPSLSITVAAYGKAGCREVDSIALFQRTRVLETLRLTLSKQWQIEDMISLGSAKQSVENGKNEKENAAVIAVLLKRNTKDPYSAVPTVGEDSDDSTDGSDDDAMDEEDDDDTMVGEVVLLIAMRRGVFIRSRMKLNSLRPLIGLHPSTYVNKILVGGESGACLINVRSNKVIHTLACLPKSTKVTAMEQAPAVDTVAIGTANGEVHLVNIRVDRLLFTLTQKKTPIVSLSFRTDSSALHYGISPLAVGCGDGCICIWDLNKNDAGSRTVLCEMKHASAKQLQYFPQEPLLLVAGDNALQMYVFDQPDHQARLLRQRAGHTQPPCLIRYRQQQGRVATSMDGTDAAACQILSSGGLDRTLRMFSTARSVLDQEFSQGKSLHKQAKKWKVDRSELLLPPTIAMAVTDDVREWGNLVTVHKQHSFAYVWSTTKQAQSGPVLRQNNWNISGKQKQPPRSTHATSVALSACGSFALVGTLGGIIYKYNVESGLPRGSFPAMPSDDKHRKRNEKLIGGVHRTANEIEKKLQVHTKTANVDQEMLDAQQLHRREKLLQAKAKAACHEGYAVTGLAVDSMNRVLISVGSDKKLILWHLQSHAPHSKSPFQLPSGASKLVHVRESDLAAIALDDFTVILFDCSSLSIVRRFGKGHTQSVSDMAFSQDGRMLFTSSLDKTVRVWDVPTNACVDWLSFASPPTALAVSPTGEFLATTHAGKLGISVWSDKSYYTTVHLGGCTLDRPIEMDEPIPISEEAENTDIEDAAVDKLQIVEDKKTSEGMSGPVIPKEQGLITLSGLPVSHWKNLFHLDLVKIRNKPKEPPKKPPSAPFFLQWRGSEPQVETEKKDTSWEAAWSDDEHGEADGLSEQKKAHPGSEGVPQLKRRKVTISRSHLATLLSEAQNSTTSTGQRFVNITNYFASLGPSAIDVELTSLCHGTHDLEEGLPLLLAACLWLTEACASHERFEAVNAYLCRFLHLHAPIMAGLDDFVHDAGEDESLDVADQRGELLTALGNLRAAQRREAVQAKEKLEHTLCLLKHFSRIV